MSEDQAVEWEVLNSIYESDPNFKKINETRLQYIFQEDEKKSFLIELEWPEEYPEKALLVNLDTFYNTHISGKTRDAIRDRLQQFAVEQEGMASSFSVIEHVKENLEDLTKDWELSSTTAIGELRIQDDSDDKKDEPLTKAAKRRMWDRNEGTKLERGYNWVDLIKHLSQTKDT